MNCPCNCSQSSSRPQPVQKEIVNVVSYLWPPYVEDCAEWYGRNCTYPGYDIDFLGNALRTLGYEMKVHMVDSIAEAVQGIQTGLFNSSGQITTLLPQFNLSHTPIIFFDSVLFITKMGDVNFFDIKPGRLLFSVSTPGVYLALFFSFLLMWIFSQKGYSRYLKYFGITLWFMLFGIYQNLYSNIFAIQLFNPVPPGKLFSSYAELYELLKKPACKLVLAGPEWTEEEKQVTLSNVIDDTTEISGILDENPPMFTGFSSKKYLDTVLETEKCRIGVTVASLLAMYQAQTSESFGIIRLDVKPDFRYGYGVQPNTPLVEKLNRYFAGGWPVRKYKDLALETELYKIKDPSKTMKHIGNVEQSGKPPVQNAKKLGLFDLFDIFFGLTSMLMAGLVAFVVEILHVGLRSREKYVSSYGIQVSRYT